MREPNGGEARKDKLDRVQEGGLDITEGELGGPRVLAYFSTNVDRGKGAVGVDKNGVMGVGAERGNEVWGGVSIKVLGPGDMVQELAVDKFFQGEPDVAALLVVDSVLMRVAVGREARRGGEEILEGADVDGGVKYRG